MRKSSAIMRRNENTSWIVHAIFIAFGICCLLPFLIVVSASFSSDLDLAVHGYSILPRKIDLKAYKTLWEAPGVIINAYKITIFTTLVSTALAMLVMSMAAYALARKSGTGLGKAVTYYLYFPSLFGGGLVPSYIVNTQYLKLTDNLLVLILPGLVSAFNIFMIRTFIQQQPNSLIEAAKIDGANELLIYSRIAIPLAKPVLATVAFNVALINWNQWYNSMLYMRSANKVTLQHLLQRMMMNMQDILLQIQKGVAGANKLSDIPGESLQMAMLVVSIGPMMFLFPFFQRFFVKGMVVGSVKG